MHQERKGSKRKAYRAFTFSTRQSISIDHKLKVMAKKFTCFLVFLALHTVIKCNLNYWKMYSAYFMYCLHNTYPIPRVSATKRSPEKAIMKIHRSSSTAQISNSRKSFQKQQQNWNNKCLWAYWQDFLRLSLCIYPHIRCLRGSWRGRCGILEIFRNALKHLCFLSCIGLLLLFLLSTTTLSFSTLKWLFQKMHLIKYVIHLRFVRVPPPLLHSEIHFRLRETVMNTNWNLYRISIWKSKL